MGSLRVLGGKVDLSTHEADITLQHWEEQLENLRQVCLCVCLCVCLSLCLVCLSVCLSVCLCVCLSVWSVGHAASLPVLDVWQPHLHLYTRQPP